MKRTIVLLSVIALLIGGWSFAWDFISGKVETVLEQTKSRFASQGKNINCADQTLDGYPFRISLNCSEIAYSDQVTGASFRAGAMRSAAQAYAPGKTVIELEGPAQLEIPAQGAFQVLWNSMRASASINLDGPQRFSMVGTDVEFKPENERFDAANMRELQLHGRRAGDNGFEIGIRSKNTVSPQGRWPEFNLDSAIILENTLSAIIKGQGLLQIARANGLSGQIRRTQYGLEDGGELSVSGPFQISRDGLVSGKFSIQLKQAEKLIEVGKKLMPEQTRLLDQVKSGLALFSGAAGPKGIEFPLTIRNGNASIGLLPLGKIRPVF